MSWKARTSNLAPSAVSASLRNRRKGPDGQELNTRITEGMTEYRCNGMVGYGLSEYLDRIVDGKPVSVGA